jgi:hypothetical protein
MPGLYESGPQRIGNIDNRARLQFPIILRTEILIAVNLQNRKTRPALL